MTQHERIAELGAENARLRTEARVMEIEIRELRGAVGEDAGKIAGSAIATARRQALEDAAACAATVLRDWADSLAATRDDYMEASRTGTFKGRRIQSDFAKRAALDFHERSCAVANTAEMTAAAIRALMGGGE